MLDQFWASVVDGGPTSGRCLVSAGTSMLFSIQHMTGGEEGGGGVMGGGVARLCVHFVFTVHRQYTRTPILHGHADR